MKTNDDDYRFAELALMESRKTRNEPGRISPLVGAVAVRSGRVLASAHRGEFAFGDHAEFGLLEKKLKNKKLAGATIYTTLEPCTKRNAPKIECVARLIERKVARVVIGMLDPNPTVRGRGELRLRAAGIAIDRFAPDLMARTEEINREFIRAQRASDDEAQAAESKEPKIRNISGIWLCQYVYPKMNEISGKKANATEAQIVRFEQSKRSVKGSTIFAIAHPEDFEGRVLNQYFTGLYFNKTNHHSYHGAFQFVISNSHNRMLGRWVGFNREGDGVDSGEWRWEQLNEKLSIHKAEIAELAIRAKRRNLFKTAKFL
jgi:pyrimidine deaminase RibD-like protein